MTVEFLLILHSTSINIHFSSTEFREQIRIIFLLICDHQMEI